MKAQVIKWLRDKYGGNATAVALAYRRFAETKEASTMLDDLRERLFIFTPTVAYDRDGRLDSHEMARREGMRDAYIYIANVLTVTEDELKPKEIKRNAREPAARTDDPGNPASRWSPDDPTLDGTGAEYPASDAASGDSSGAE